MFMKNIIVTGCHGQLGIAVNKLLGSREDYNLINTDVAELDITKVDKVLELAREVKPYAIINCAAYTAVDAAEEHLDLNYKDNPKPLTEFDPVGPKSVYGITKLAGENFVKDFARNYFIIRTAWLYGEGKNFVRTMLRLSETHEEVSVVNDQFGSPTSTAELAKAIECLLPTDNYGLFHGTCEGSTSWDEFTREIFRLAGRTTKVNSVSTAQYQEKNPQAAPRPHYSILDNYMFRLTTDFMYKDWQSALDDYMTEQGYKA